MKYLRMALMWLGALCAVIVVLAVVFSWRALGFLDEHRGFVTQFTRDLAAHWRVEDVYERLSVDFVESLSRPESRAFIRNLARFGPLQDATDFQIGNVQWGTDGTLGEIKFKARFAHAQALVVILVVKKDGAVRVQALNMSSVEAATIPEVEREA